MELDFEDVEFSEDTMEPPLAPEGKAVCRLLWANVALTYDAYVQKKDGKFTAEDEKNASNWEFVLGFAPQRYVDGGHEFERGKDYQPLRARIRGSNWAAFAKMVKGTPFTLEKPATPSTLNDRLQGLKGLDFVCTIKYSYSGKQGKNFANVRINGLESGDTDEAPF